MFKLLKNTKNKSKFSAIYRRTQIIFAITVVSITLIIYMLLENKMLAYLDFQIQKRQEFIQNIFKSNKDLTLKIYNVKLSQLLSDSELIDAIQKQDREKLFKIATPFYEEGIDDNLSLMTFRNSNGVTLLRMHKKEFICDKLEDSKKILLAVNKEHSVKSGFEVDNLQLTFRIVYPIFDHHGTYHGSVEIGFKPEHFIQPMDKLMDMYVNLFVATKYISAYSNISNLEIEDKYALIQANKDISRDLLFSSIDEKKYLHLGNNHEHILYKALPLLTFDGQKIGYMAIDEDISYYSKENNSLLFTIILSIFIGALIIIILIRTSMNYYIQNIEHSVLIDPLTGLQNQSALIAAMEEHTNYVLILTDINKFHLINDIYGGKSGNEVLKKHAELLSAFGEKYFLEVYRIASDEFAFLTITKDYSYERIESLVRKLLNHINTYIYTLENGEEIFSIDVTAGIAFADNDALEHAEQALHIAQRFDKPFEIFQPHLNTKGRSIEILKIKNNIQYALAQKLVEPYYQAIVNREEKIVKHEVLMRLFDQDENICMPDSFLPVAHMVHLYPKLSYTLLEKIKRVFEAVEHVKLSVNISISDVHDTEITHILEEILSINQKRNTLIIEIVENESIDDYDDMNLFITNMKSKGALIAIDDFGSGYSNYQHILELKPDYIKIDGSLIKNIVTDEKAQILVKSISDFAHNLEIKVIAEYVANKEIFDLLLSYDIDEFQGYYFSVPQPKRMDEVTKLIYNCTRH